MRDAVFSSVRKLKPHTSKSIEEAWAFLLDAELVPPGT